MFIIFGSYGLGMWYGAEEVADDLRDHCTGSDCRTGGQVMTVFWAILNGAMVRAPPVYFPTSRACDAKMGCFCSGADVLREGHAAASLRRECRCWKYPSLG